MPAVLPLLAWTSLVTATCPAAPQPTWASTEADVFAAWLDTGPLPVADGFGSPFEGGDGGVRAPMNARLTAAGPERLLLEAIAYENHHKRVVQVAIAGVGVQAGLPARVRRGENLGTMKGEPAVCVWVDGEPVPDPAAFVRDRARLFDPHREPRLVLVDQASGRLQLHEQGEVVEEVRVGFGQEPGRKRVRGDNRSPQGMYFIVSRHRGAFGGPYAAYYGGHWLKLSYPNAYDAAYGLEQGLLTGRVAADIARSWRARTLPPQGTALGGGIGFHGWIGPWSDDDPWLSWGCVVFHNEDVRELYDRLPEGTMVVLL